MHWWNVDMVKPPILRDGFSTRVLVFSIMDERVGIADYSDVNKSWYDDSGGLLDAITHWADLPKGPNT